MYKVVPGAAGRHRRHHCLRLYFSSRGPRCSHCRNDSFARPQLQGAPLYTRRSQGVDTPHNASLGPRLSPIHPSAHHTPRTWHGSPIRCVGPFCSVPPQEGRLPASGRHAPQLLANLGLAVAAWQSFCNALPGRRQVTFSIFYNLAALFWRSFLRPPPRRERSVASGRLWREQPAAWCTHARSLTPRRTLLRIASAWRRRAAWPAG